MDYAIERRQLNVDFFTVLMTVVITSALWLYFIYAMNTHTYSLGFSTNYFKTKSRTYTGSYSSEESQLKKEILQAQAKERIKE